MAQPQPPDPTAVLLPERNPFIHNAAIAGTIICPLAMLLPPRKIDLRFFVLAGGLSLSTNQLAYAYTGKSIYARFQNRAASALDISPLPESALRTQQLIREQKEARDRKLREQARQQQDDEKGRIVKLAEDVWMGGEGKDWQAKRAAEHAKSFEEGKGMGGIIIDQIKDVWGGNWKPSSEKVSDAELKEREKEEKEK